MATEQISPSQLVSRNKEKTKSKEKPTLDQNLLERHLYSTFYLLPKTEQVDIILDFEIEVNHVILIVTKPTPHKSESALHL